MTPLVGVFVLQALAAPVPTLDAFVSLKRAQATAISPDGRLVAYVVRETNWEENAFETEIFLAGADGGTPRQLTNAKKSSDAPAWSPDGRFLAFLSDRTDKRQLYRIAIAGGEAEVLTTAEDGVSSFQWSPDGKQIAYVANDPKPEALKERDKKYGEFEVVDQDHRMSHLHVIELASKESRRLTDGAFVVGGFDWSPDGNRIAFDHRVNNDPSNSGTADISIVEVATKAIRPLVKQDGPDRRPLFSPDGSSIAFETAAGDPAFYYKNSRLARIPADGGAIEVLSASFDELPSLVGWGKAGIFFQASQRTESALYRLDPALKHAVRVSGAATPIATSFSLSADAATVAFVASSASAFPEVYVAPVATMAPKRLTDLGAQLRDFTLGRSEVVSWKSQDGASIEGVLHKPADWKPGARRPLLVVIHGGPTGVSRPGLVRTNYVYPIDHWLSKGALVLEPNYRGSAGYGEAFRSLNLRNLGVGDAWDVISGVDHLVSQGLADNDRVGVMGWSQGGYISAFLTTHDSARFKAVSVGAGISDWMTYYVNTDIHPFTRQYLRATPWDDPEIYAKTSPITYVKGAKAPTLIQHGEKDLRVPIPNAYELYQGIQDQGVPVKLIVYKGFGHGLNKPKAQRAALEHNLEWFDRYVFGETGSPAQ